MGFFKKDKSSLTTAQQEQQQRQQQQLLETTQAQLRQAEATISQLQDQLREENRRAHLYTTQANRLTSDLQSSRIENARLVSELQNLRAQLGATQGNLTAESNQRQVAENRAQEAEFRYSMVVSSMEEELERARRQLDQMNREKEEHSRLCRLGGRTPNGGPVMNTGGAAPQSQTNTPVAVNGSPHVIAARQSVPSFRSVSMGIQPPGSNDIANGNGRSTPGAPPHPGQPPQAYPVRPRSAMNFGPPSHIQPPRAPNTTSNSHNRANSAVQRIPESIAELPTGQESTGMSEEAQHRRAILESAEIARYEERIRTAEASREQMQNQFTALSGEVASLKKTLEEKDRELFVRDNQLEWVQQRAAALMRGDGDSPFLAD